MSAEFQTTPTEVIATERLHRRLAFGFASLVALTLCLIVLGALVRAHDAGLACPDWPLCFGGFIPKMDLKVGFEWSHRVLASVVTLIFAALGVAAWRNRAGCEPLPLLLCAAVVLLAIQIALGGLTVLLELASWTVTAHLIVGNSFVATALLIALTLRQTANGERATAPVSDPIRAWVTASAAVLLLQIALGGLVSSRYAGMACPEWPTCNGGVWFPTWEGSVGLHLLHRLNGYALFLCMGWAAWICRGEPRLRAAMTLALAIVLVQIGVGVANVLWGIPVEITGLHTGLAGALVLTLTVALHAAWSGRLARAARLAPR